MSVADQKVLLVEDSEEHALLLKSILQDIGVKNVVHCTDGAQALKLLEERMRFDLFLIDVVMPGMTGFEFVQKAIDKRIQTPVIFITGNASQADVVKGVLLGASDYIKKPFNPALVKERIKAKLHFKAAA